MRVAIIFLLSVLVTSAQTIATRVITPGAPTQIALSPQLTTTLLFPAVPAGTFGLGLVGQGGNVSTGSVQIEHPDGSQIIVLHALSESADVMMTVLLQGELYVFDLRSAPVPDVAITLVKADAAAPRAVEVTPEEIKAARPRYDPELMIGFLRRAHNAALMRKLYPAFTRDTMRDLPITRATAELLRRPLPRSIASPRRTRLCLRERLRTRPDMPLASTVELQL